LLELADFFSVLCVDFAVCSLDIKSMNINRGNAHKWSNGIFRILFSKAFIPLLDGASSRRFKIGACEWSLGKSDPSCFDVQRKLGLMVFRLIWDGRPMVCI
jgi:hypothetical protein